MSLEYRNDTTLLGYIEKLMPLLKKAHPKESTEMQDVRAFEVTWSKLSMKMRYKLDENEVRTLADLIDKGPAIERRIREYEKEGSRINTSAVGATWIPTSNMGSNFPTKDIPETKREEMRGYNQGNTRGDNRLREGIRERYRQECTYCGKQGHYAVGCWRNPDSAYFKPGLVPGNRRDTNDDRRVMRSNTMNVQPNNQRDMPFRDRFQPKMEQTGTEKRRCYTCQEVGHIAPHCPKKNQQRGQAGSRLSGEEIAQLAKQVADIMRASQDAIPKKETRQNGQGHRGRHSRLFKHPPWETRKTGYQRPEKWQG